MTRAAILLSPAVLALLLYLPVRSAFFLSDDFEFLLNASRTSLSEIGWIPSQGSDWYRPIPFALWRLNYLWFGFDPVGYRATNLLLHAVNAVLVAGLAMRVQRSLPAGLVAGVFFAAQPRGAGTVAWLAGRFDLVATLFVLLAVHACISSHRTGAWGWRIATAGAASAALASKESAVATPLLLLLLASRPLCRLSGLGDRQVGRSDAFAGCLLVGIYFALRFLLLGDLGGYGWHDRIAPLQLLNPLLVLPAILAGFGPASPAALFLPWLGFACVVAVVLARVAPLWLAFVVAATLPAASMFWPATYFWELDRFLYLPAVGAALALSAVRQRLSQWPRSNSAVATTVVLVLVALNIAYAYPRIAAWRDAAGLSWRVHELLVGHRETIPDGAVIDCALLPDNVAGAYAYRKGCDSQVEIVRPDGRVRGIYANAGQRPDFVIERDGRALRPVGQSPRPISGRSIP